MCAWIVTPLVDHHQLSRVAGTKLYICLNLKNVVYLFQHGGASFSEYTVNVGVHAAKVEHCNVYIIFL